VWHSKIRVHDPKLTAASATLTTPLTAGTLPIQERFVSLQGEGELVGVPSSFIRVSGCNLRCTWCDTPASSWAPESVTHTLDELVKFCAAGPRHVVVTGGEPLLFPGTAALTRRLSAAGHHITIETAGTVWRDATHQALRCDLMSISPKLSHSTPWQRAPRLAHRHEEHRLALKPLRTLLSRFDWQLKFVVKSADPRSLARDLGEIEILLTQLAIARRDRHRVLLMPECTEPATLLDHYQSLIAPCLAHGFRVGERLHLQLFGHTPGT
jgi:7-carboxy-7-deazaguanine synthase